MPPKPCSHTPKKKGKASAIIPQPNGGAAATRRQQDAQRRLNKLCEVYLFVHDGLSLSAACRKARISWVSRFRWERRLRAGNGFAGLVSKPKGPATPAAIREGLRPGVLARVQMLAVLKGSTVAAWKTFAQEPTCPPALRSAILGREVPEALRSAIGIKRKVVTVRVAIFKAGNFSHRHELKSRRRAA